MLDIDAFTYVKWARESHWTDNVETDRNDEAMNMVEFIFSKGKQISIKHTETARLYLIYWLVVGLWNAA